MAAENDQCEVVRVLLELDPSLLRMQDVKGRTALHVAALKGCEATMRLILDVDDDDISTMLDNDNHDAAHYFKTKLYDLGCKGGGTVSGVEYDARECYVK
eukprot:PhF_6_TR13028/c1_g3_i11/m.20669